VIRAPSCLAQPSLGRSGAGYPCTRFGRVAVAVAVKVHVHVDVDAHGDVS
jgi:hypothetical protein